MDSLKPGFVFCFIFFLHVLQTSLKVQGPVQWPTNPRLIMHSHFPDWNWATDVHRVPNDSPTLLLSPLLCVPADKSRITKVSRWPAGETWGQLLIFNSFRVSLLLATRTFRDGSSTGVSSILMEDRDLELTNTTVSADTKWAWGVGRGCSVNQNHLDCSTFPGITSAMGTKTKKNKRIMTNRAGKVWPVTRPWSWAVLWKSAPRSWWCSWRAGRGCHMLLLQTLCSCPPGLAATGI